MDRPCRGGDELNEGSMCMPIHARARGRPHAWRAHWRWCPCPPCPAWTHAWCASRPGGCIALVLLLLLRPAPPACKVEVAGVRRKHRVRARSGHPYHHHVLRPDRSTWLQRALKTRLSLPGWDAEEGEAQEYYVHARTARLHLHPVRLHATASMHHRP